MDSALSVLGIIVSVVLFLFGYRRTVGAKKERISAANTEVERVLIRRVVVEGYEPSVNDLARFIGGKARDFRVRRPELVSTRQLLNTVYTRVVESDLISSEYRHEILDRLEPALSAAESEPYSEESLEAIDKVKESRTHGWWVTVALGIGASVLGAVFSAVPTLKLTDFSLSDLVPEVAMVVAFSLAAIGAIFGFYRARASQEEIASQATEISENLQFEAQVFNAIAPLADVARQTGRANGADMLVIKDGKKIAIEVKNWRRAVPRVLILRTISKLSDFADEVGASQSYVVVPRPFPHGEQFGGDNVQIVSLRTLQKIMRGGG